VAKSTERTSFTKDVQGRYLCNDLTEVNAWKNSGGRPFDVIVIGGGTFGSAIAERIRVSSEADRRWLAHPGPASTPQQPRFIGLQTHTGQVLFRRIQWKAL
jgi:hypothetical protein